MDKLIGKSGKKSVISIIEITKPVTPSTVSPTIPTDGGEEEEEKKRKGNEARSLSLHQYHLDVGEMGKKIVKYSISLSPDNLLSVKMALMQAVQSVEKKLKENVEK